MPNNTTNYNLVKPAENEYYDISVPNGNMDIIDSALTPTADPAQVPTGLSGKLSQWVSWFANRIKAITGKANWYDAPTKSLEEINTALTSHQADNTAHITSAERTAWNGKIDKSLATAANDFLVASGAGAWVKKTLAEVKTILGLGSAAYTASTDYATAAQGTLAANAIPKSTVTTANDFIVATGNAAVTRKSLSDTRNMLEAPIVAVAASKTLALTDADTLQNCTNGAAITITIPPNSTVAFTVGTEIAILRNGAGTINIAPSAGVTLSSDTNKRSIKNQYMAAALKKIATDTWILAGGLSV